MNFFAPLSLCTMALTVATLSSCASMNPATEKRAYCNTLKSDIVFNAATSVTRDANIQTSEKPLEENNYDKIDCDAR